MTLVTGCREQGLFLRDLSGMGSRLGPRALRIAVKDAATKQRMLRIIERSGRSLGRSWGRSWGQGSTIDI